MVFDRYTLTGTVSPEEAGLVPEAGDQDYAVTRAMAKPS